MDTRVGSVYFHEGINPTKPESCFIYLVSHLALRTLLGIFQGLNTFNEQMSSQEKHWEEDQTVDSQSQGMSKNLKIE